MGVTVCLPLFGAAGQEMEQGQLVRGQHLRELAVSLTERLQAAATLLDRLIAAGWSAQVALCDVILSTQDVHTRAEAETRLREQGVNPELFVIFEDVEEDDSWE
jgi:hypothetical protein